jgi:DNA-binding transcriptional ArsR family regulator
MAQSSEGRRPAAAICEVRCINEQDVARTRTQQLESETYSGLASLFAALGDATRARIVHVLLRQEMCTCDISAVVGVSESAVSQHLRLLRELHLVKFRRQGKLVYYSLDDSHVAELVRVGLTHLGHSGELIPLTAPAPAGSRNPAA